jgi:hypothetical protein
MVNGAPPRGLQSGVYTDALRQRVAQVPETNPAGAQLHPQTTQPLSKTLSLLSLLTLFYMTLSLLYFLLSLPIILTVLLGTGLGATTPSDWTPAQKLLVSFLPNSHTALGSDLLVTHKPQTSHSFATSCRAICQFHSLHTTRALISTGTGKTWPLCLALRGALVYPTLAILAFVFLISLLPSYPLAIWPPASLAPDYVG